MAVVTTKSVAITNRDASPRVLNNGRIDRAPVLEFIGFVAAVSGDSIGSRYIFGQLPSNARISAIALTCSAITTCAGDIGLYQTTNNGGAVLPGSSKWSAAKSLAAALTGANITYDSAAGVGDVSKCEQPLWQQLGLTSDPGVSYDVCVTLTAAAGSAGSISVKATWCE